MDILTILATKADQVEVTRVSGEATRIFFEASKLKTSAVEETSGVAVRVIKDGRLGFAATSDESALDKLVGNAVQSVAFSEVIPNLRFPGRLPAAPVQTFDERIAALPVAAMVDMGRHIIEHILDIEPEARVDVRVNRTVQRMSIRNQAGADVSVQASPLSIVISVTRIQGDDVLMVFDATGSTLWTGNYMAGARRVGEKLTLAKTLVPITGGRMPVLFSPFGVLVLGLPLMLGLNGKNACTGISPMKGRIGEQIFDRRLTVIDDATIDGRFGSAPYDDEGIPHRRNTLIENGVLKAFFYDLKTAAQADVTPTGNGSRSLFSQPTPASTNVLIAEGEMSLADMVTGMNNGLVVDTVLGLGQGNIISGAFSNPVALGFKVEKGAIVGRVKNVSIAGNIYDILKDVAAMSRETEWVYNSYKLPSILVPAMNVVAKA